MLAVMALPRGSKTLIYFGNPTQTLSSRCVAIVVLEVTFTFRPLYKEF